jgi:hypothetical protein
MRPNPENTVDIINVVFVSTQKYLSANIVQEDDSYDNLVNVLP